VPLIGVDAAPSSLPADPSAGQAVPRRVQHVLPSCAITAAPGRPCYTISHNVSGSNSSSAEAGRGPRPFDLFVIIGTTSTCHHPIHRGAATQPL
jgi:hypothetical protein